MQTIRDEHAATRSATPITVNGRPREIAPGTTVAALLEQLELDQRLVVVEHNGNILRGAALLSSTALRRGDALELVHFVGGG